MPTTPGTVYVQDTIEMMGGVKKPVVLASRIGGGRMMIVATAAALETDVPAAFREVGMEVKVLDYNGQGKKIVELGQDLQTWTIKTEEGSIPISEKGAAGGVAELDAEGYIPNTRIRQILLNTIVEAADQAARYALNVTRSTICIQLDTGASYLKLNNDAPPTTADDWALLGYTQSVVSINGQTGIVAIDFNGLLAFGQSGIQFNTAVANSQAMSQVSAALASLQQQVSQISVNLAIQSYSWTASEDQKTFIIPSAPTNEIQALVSLDIEGVPQDLRGGLISINANKTGVVLAADDDEILSGYVVSITYSKTVAQTGDSGLLAVVAYQNRYDTIADMLNNQSQQTQGLVQYVRDASADPSISSGWAEYEYLGTTNASLSDYRKRAEEESLDQQSIITFAQDEPSEMEDIIDFGND